jgi:hypothetical protein
LVLAVSPVFGQENVLYSSIQQAKAANVEFQALPSVLVRESAPDDKLLSSKFNNIEEVQFFTYDASGLTGAGRAISLDIPLKKGTLSLELMEVSDAFYEYEVVTSDGETYPANRNFKHYRGIVRNDPNSKVAVSFLDDEIMGLIATDEGNLVIGKETVYGKHLLYDDKNLKDKPAFECETFDDLFVPYDPEVLSGAFVTACQRNVRFYVETEYDIYQSKGSVSNVEAYITGVFNQVATLYTAESIPTVISIIYVWTSTDPYTGTTTDALLYQFQSTRTSINGDLGMLLTFRPELGGGMAAGFDGLCNPSTSKKLAVSMIYSTYSTLPTYSWTVYVVTHEFGHLLGSRHTHACVWNGNSTAIDGCAGYTENAAGTDYGDCPLPGDPPEGGTIMSYCEFAPVGTNFNLGFGPQPGNVIRNSYYSAACLATVSISGPDPFPYQQYATYSSQVAGTWSVTAPLSIYSGQGTNSVVLSCPQFSNIHSSTLTLEPDGFSCSVSKYIEIPRDTIWGYSFSLMAYPNPAIDVVNIDIQENVASPATVKASEKDVLFTIRLYDQEGALRKELKTMDRQISISVSDLRNGVYILHVYASKAGKPQSIKLIVKH